MQPWARKKGRFWDCHLALHLILTSAVKDSGLKSVVAALSTALAVVAMFAGISSASAQTIKVGLPGYYQACLEKPEFTRIAVMLPQFVRPDIERPNFQNQDKVRPEIVKPIFVKPELVRPLIVRAEYDNRCDRYVATSLLSGGLNMNYTEKGVVSYDIHGARTLALAQQMIAKADASQNAGFTMSPRDLVKMNSEECSCGNGVNTANTPVVVRR